jgi:hypothetical protein
MSTESDATKTKHKIAILIEKHIITTKIGHLLKALDNCSKTTNVRPEDKTAAYVIRTESDKLKSEPNISSYKITAETGKNVIS